MSSNLSALHRQQRGITLIEVAVSLAIVSLVVAGVVTLIGRYMEDTRLTLAGQHMKTIGDASSAFIRDNYTSILNRLNDPLTPAGAELLRIDVNDDLIAEGYLPAGYSSMNHFGQTLCTLVRQQSAPSGRIVLEGLLVTEGGKVLDDISIALMASQAGSAGGAFYEYPLDPEGTGADIFGVLGGWNLAKSKFEHDNIGFDPSVTTSSNCSGDTGGTGQVVLKHGHAFQALWLDDTVNTTAFLYRDDVGDPLFNTMNTDLHMGGNFIDGLVQVSAGDACMQAQTDPPSPGPDYAEEGAIANNPDGFLMVCRNNAWKLAGGIPVVDKYSDLTACSNDGEVAVVRHGDETVGGVDSGDGRPRLFICSTMSGDWEPAGLDELGNLDSYGEVRVHSTVDDSGPTKGITIISGTPNFDTSVVPCTPGTITTTRTGSIMECLAEIDPDDSTFDCGNNAAGYPIGSKAIAANPSLDGSIKAGELILCVTN
jgi:prepilin-type N-terminal cleavage/methylation domain-containing protein